MFSSEISPLISENARIARPPDSETSLTYSRLAKEWDFSREIRTKLSNFFVNLVSIC